MIHCQIDLRARARRAVLEAGFHPDFGPEIQNEVHSFQKNHTNNSSENVRDLRALLWSSIDNDTSRDLDQVEYAEQLPDGSVRLLVGIADVDSAVPKGCAMDHKAALDTTSVYTGAEVFPMLPGELSNDLTSLVGGQERRAIVIEMHVLKDGSVPQHDAYYALIFNRAKLAYDSTGAWLEGRGPIPAPITAVPGMEQQLRLQLATSETLRALRREHGALNFESVEARAVLRNGEVDDLAIVRQNSARNIIESFMVAANVAMAEFLKQRGLPSLRRVVKTPERWERIRDLAAQFGAKLPTQPDPRALADFLAQRRAADADHFPDLSLAIIKLLGPGEYIVERPGTEHEGHFGLAVHDYTHSTAPNRRFADLVTQRLLKAGLAGASNAYSIGELAEIATRCTEREHTAKKVERLMRKVIAANVLCSRTGEIFDGIITGANAKGTFIRLLKFPAEGMVVRGAKGLDVGDKARVRLVSVEVEKGYIDFERL